MPSKAYSDHLLFLLQDADELLDIHVKLRTGRPGRQWGLGSVNRAVVVMCVSAWEAYIEQVILQVIAALKPTLGSALDAWPALDGLATQSVKRFNNPDVDNVKKLIKEYIGVPDITSGWRWPNCRNEKARRLLKEALRLRHNIAHGVNPRPTVRSAYVTRLVKFFRRLGKCTDDAIYDYVVNNLGATPW